jgi:hypothetical protein
MRSVKKYKRQHILLFHTLVNVLRIKFNKNIIYQRGAYA